MDQQPRILGLDIGDRRVGIAMSDAFGMTAQPLLTLGRSTLRQELKNIGRLLRKHQIAEIVAGNPLYMSGDQSPQATKAQAFAAAIRDEFHLPVHLWDERLTTTEAHRQLDDMGYAQLGRKGIIDQVAAVLILQSWLDAQALRRTEAQQ